ncbi:MAG: selenite/tellurite reduction operon rhodanese-like protein ExtH [Desulfuromonadaceae bacterium]|nr:selenite/tellurite reduction operon rhodanese-like protein ExtH [Desulfuromonadaceae bacterium]MDD2848786.1 selenite/tellurite reduction operon rhodanese-like protein ExtH [Desulfuromonadaceae bacterium]MDD4130436.1 selenite/tellurite reduction operon rhodanese-like protein ExtH [Desulfuromonadaceae bacterium]
MSEKLMKKGRVLIAALLGTVMIAALTIWGCGTSSYDDPAAGANITTTKTANALIDAATLKTWMDEGKVNAPVANNYDRVVILSVTGPTTSATTSGYIGYNTLHIPGAQLWDSTSKLGYARREAVADMSTMVPDGASMDALIKSFGINKYTTVVFTVSKSQNFLYAARAYFTFRYWGFPKDRLKVLNGGDDAWANAAYTLTSVVPEITPSTYSVRNIYTGNYSSFGLRYSIGDMIALVDKVNLGTESTADPDGITILDARGPNADTTYDYDTAHIFGATKDNYNSYGTTSGTNNVGTVATPVNAPKTRTFNGTAPLTTADKKMNIVYCVSGYRASVPFFVLDGILGWPVKMYDGSWGQWSSYQGVTNLPDVNGTPSMWRVDINSRSVGSLTGSLPIADNLYLGFTSVLDPEANQILKADKIYFSTPPVSTTTSGGAAGGGSGC